MTVRALFVTRVYEASLAAERGFAELNTELEEACLSLAQEDMAGRAWCREHRYGGYTSYASLNDLPWRFPEFARLYGRSLGRDQVCSGQAAKELAVQVLHRTRHV